MRTDRRSFFRLLAGAAALLADSAARERMSADLAELVRPFLDTTASDTTAKILLDLIETHEGCTPPRRALEQCAPA